jgi:DNA-binding MarR family transcriptional regulator
MNNSEDKVLAIFRLYGVTPYQMLCLDRTAQTELKAPLDRLIKKGMIVRERRQDAYHLTPTGYAAVRQGTS